MDPARVNVPVIGGHAGKTIIPLISQVSVSPCLGSCKIRSTFKRLLLEVLKTERQRTKHLSYFERISCYRYSPSHCLG